LTIFLSACGTAPFCKAESANSGLIIDNAPSICVNNISSQGNVIRNKNELLALGDSTCTQANIDFSSESLLGISTSGGGCEIGFKREVTSKASEKKLHYKVTVKTCGLCKKLGSSNNLVRVSKIPDDWTVTFEVDED